METLESKIQTSSSDFTNQNLEDLGLNYNNLERTIDTYKIGEVDAFYSFKPPKPLDLNFPSLVGSKDIKPIDSDSVPPGKDPLRIYKDYPEEGSQYHIHGDAALGAVKKENKVVSYTNSYETAVADTTLQKNKVPFKDKTSSEKKNK